MLMGGGSGGNGLLDIFGGLSLNEILNNDEDSEIEENSGIYYIWRLFGDVRISTFISNSIGTFINPAFSIFHSLTHVTYIFKLDDSITLILFKSRCVI